MCHAYGTDPAVLRAALGVVERSVRSEDDAVTFFRPRIRAPRGTALAMPDRSMFALLRVIRDRVSWQHNSCSHGSSSNQIHQQRSTSSPEDRTRR
jgi:hypothetical protein